MIYSYSVQQEESLYVFQPWGGGDEHNSYEPNN